MALINKFFSSRKKVYVKHQDISERTFTFTKDQVRLVLFRECDFRGRKLLFDSQSVQKIPITHTENGKQTPVSTTTTTTSSSSPNKTEIYCEITNGYRYQYSRPNNDIIQLGEIVFGTVAMSFRGTSLKIHSFNLPAKLMCTQIFPSPKHQIRGRVSVASQQFDALRSNTNSSVQSLEKSAKFDYSSTSSTTSFNEQISLHSTESEVKLRSTTGSVPLDVPTNNENQSMMSAKVAPSLEGDSGFCGEQSYSSVSSGPPSMSLWDTRHDYASVHGFSCGSLYKRWLRSASTSLDYNACSDSSMSTGVHSTASADECITRGNHRSSKLGLAVIINLSEGQEIDLERFLLEHSALIEAMVCRARAGAESAYTKPSNFASLMYEVYKETSQWLVSLITGPTINCYLWHVLGQRIKVKQFVCDSITKTKSESSLMKTKSDRTKDVHMFSSSLFEIDNKRKNFDTSLRRSILRPLTNYSLSNEKIKNCSSASVTFINDAENFVQQLCELLESVDTKHTNFFISTLMTAVLTHHLGWVSTVLPPSQTDKDTLNKLHSPCNPLWGQLSDLYGAVGSPTKVARTIVCGNANNNAELISKILYTLTYFIRCSIVERNSLSRYSTEDENKEADHLTQKKYEKPAKASQINSDKVEELEMITFTPEKNQNETSKTKPLGLSRTKTCLGELKQENTISEHVLLDTVTSLGLNVSKWDFDASKQIANVIHSVPEEKTNVIFVLGDNDELVGLKKDSKNNNDEKKTDLMNENVTLLNIPSCSNERPKNLNIPNKQIFHCGSSSDTTPELTSPNCYHSSSSETPNSPCSECVKNLSKESKVVMTRSSIINLEAECSNPETQKNDNRRRGEEYNRSQSVPPSDKTQRKCSKNGCKKKYSGVKFDFKQYPQIYKNYMRSKNLPFAEKDLKLNRSFSVSLYDCSTKYDSPSCDCVPHSEETLQTPSNATELEFTSELTEKYEFPRSRDKSDKKRKNSTTKIQHPLIETKEKENNAIFEHDTIDTYECTKVKEKEKENKMTLIELQMPRIITKSLSNENIIGYSKTLLRGISNKYISDMVLQGTSSSPKTWEHILKRDLQLSSRKPLLDQPVHEAVAIVANIDTWEVQLVSSQKYIVEKSCENRVGMSQLIANMLETLLHMWKLRIPPEYCLMHIESRLREFCIRSKALAQLLLDTEFCNMNFLTSTMQLEVNDVPLLMAVASTHSPQVTQKYGLSFQ